MERRRAMFSRFLFYFIGGADNRRRGQREERTAWVADRQRTAGSVAGGCSEDSGRCIRRGQRGGHREERTATVVDIKKGSITFKREFFRIYLKRSSLKGSFLSNLKRAFRHCNKLVCCTSFVEDSGMCRRRGQRGGQREERTATMVDTKKGSI